MVLYEFTMRELAAYIAMNSVQATQQRTTYKTVGVLGGYFSKASHGTCINVIFMGDRVCQACVYGWGKYKSTWPCNISFNQSIHPYIFSRRCQLFLRSRFLWLWRLLTEHDFRPLYVQNSDCSQGRSAKKSVLVYSGVDCHCQAIGHGGCGRERDQIFLSQRTTRWRLGRHFVPHWDTCCPDLEREGLQHLYPTVDGSNFVVRSALELYSRSSDRCERRLGRDAIAFDLLRVPNLVIAKESLKIGHTNDQSRLLDHFEMGWVSYRRKGAEAYLLSSYSTLSFQMLKLSSWWKWEPLFLYAPPSIDKCVPLTLLRLNNLQHVAWILFAACPLKSCAVLKRCCLFNLKGSFCHSKDNNCNPSNTPSFGVWLTHEQKRKHPSVPGWSTQPSTVESSVHACTCFLISKNPHKSQAKLLSYFLEVQNQVLSELREEFRNHKQPQFRAKHVMSLVNFMRSI